MICCPLTRPSSLARRPLLACLLLAQPFFSIITIGSCITRSKRFAAQTHTHKRTHTYTHAQPWTGGKLISLKTTAALKSKGEEEGTSSSLCVLSLSSCLLCQSLCRNYCCVLLLCLRSTGGKHNAQNSKTLTTRENSFQLGERSAGLRF